MNIRNKKYYPQAINANYTIQMGKLLKANQVEFNGVLLNNWLRENMKYTINVGLTHWSEASAKPKEGIIAERSEFFFAPGHIQRRIKEWGAATFDQKTATFLMDTAAKTKEWLTFKKVEGLAEMAAIHPDVCEGKIPANEGLIVEL